MTTRVISGACCCRPPAFGTLGHLWVMIDTTYGQVNGVHNVCTSYTATYVSEVPTDLQITTTYTGAENKTQTSPPNANWLYMDEFDKTSLFVASSQNPYLNGGPEGKSMDPDDWAALVTSLSPPSFLFARTTNDTPRSLVGLSLGEIGDSASIPWTRRIVLSSEWSIPFSFRGANYLATFPENSNLVRDVQMQKISAVEYDNSDGAWTVSTSWYAKYDLSGATITYAPSGSGDGGGSGGSGE